MKKSVRIALLMIAAGLCIVLIALCLARFDFAALLAKNHETQTVAVEEAFDRIVVESDSFDVSVIPAADGACRVTGPVDETVSFTVEVSDGELRVASKEEKPWYAYISISISAKDSVVVELPEAEYAVLDVACASGNVSIDSKFSFAQVDVVCASGSIDCRADADTMELTTTSGEIFVSGGDFGTVSLQTASGSIDAGDLCAKVFDAVSSSGNVRLSQIRADSVRLKTSSGSAALTGVIAENALQAEASSGNIRLDRCDADNLRLTVTSGEIRGTLLSPKRFEFAEIGSGRISVPKDADGGLCTLTTGSGDIRIEIAE